MFCGAELLRKLLASVDSEFQESFPQIKLFSFSSQQSHCSSLNYANKIRRASLLDFKRHKERC